MLLFLDNRESSEALEVGMIDDSRKEAVTGRGLGLALLGAIALAAVARLRAPDETIGQRLRPRRNQRAMGPAQVAREKGTHEAVIVDPEPGFLQEHRELRAEIRQSADSSAKALHFGILLTAAAVATAPDLKNGPLLFFMALGIASLWYETGRQLLAISRLATYLQIFVENEVPGLQWEHRAEPHPINTAVRSRAFGNLIFPAMYLLHGVLMFKYWAPMNWLVWSCGGVLVVFLMAMFIRDYLISKYGRDEEKENWLKIRRAGGGRA